MKNFNVAKRYAKALFELGKETNTLDDVMLALNNITLALADTPEFGKVLFNPLVKPEEKHEVVKTITSNKTVLRFIGLLARRKRIGLINLVHDELRALHDLENGLSRILVRTARSLSDSEKRTIETEMVKSFGGKIEGKFEVSPELLGGIWIKLGDRVLDASYKGRFDDLKHHLIHSSN